MMSTAPLVVHLLYRFEFGGLQSLLADCIARMAGMRHVVVCLAGADPDAAHGLGAVDIIALDRPGRGAWRTHLAFFSQLRRLRPALLQTYNIGTLEYAVTGALAGVPRRIHAEHGRGMHERLGTHTKYNLLRRAIAPLVETFVTVSDDMVVWLDQTVGIPPSKIRLVRNGIDLARFRPAAAPRAADTPYTIGTIGRLDAIKAQADLVDAFILLRARDRTRPLRLVIVGAGPLQGALAQQIRAAGLDDCVWLPGARRDVAAIMQALDVFVLPSLSEATPITLLEAMACGVPVVATSVGGVPGLLGIDARGTLVAPSDPAALAAAIGRYLDDPQAARRHAAAARRFVADYYDIAATAAQYAALYAPAAPLPITAG